MERKIRVLIADDFVYLREDLTELINKQEDMEVVGTAASGSEIVELAEKTDHDIILLDIEMEKTNAGILAAEAIRDDNPDSMIIFLTAHETKEMILTAMGAGAVDYVVQGLDDEVLLTPLCKAESGILSCRNMRGFKKVREACSFLYIVYQTLQELKGNWLSCCFRGVRSLRLLI